MNRKRETPPTTPVEFAKSQNLIESREETRHGLFVNINSIPPALAAAASVSMSNANVRFSSWGSILVINWELVKKRYLPNNPHHGVIKWCSRRSLVIIKNKPNFA